MNGRTDVISVEFHVTNNFLIGVNKSNSILLNIFSLLIYVVFY